MGTLNFFKPKPKPSKPTPKPSISDGHNQISRMDPITPIAVALQESKQNMQIVGDNGNGNQIVNKDENDGNEDSSISNERSGKRRMRQPDLFETLGKFQ